jgi:hypothetical protein
MKRDRLGAACIGAVAGTLGGAVIAALWVWFSPSNGKIAGTRATTEATETPAVRPLRVLPLSAAGTSPVSMGALRAEAQAT